MCELNRTDLVMALIAANIISAVIIALAIVIGQRVAYWIIDLENRNKEK